MNDDFFSTFFRPSGFVITNIDETSLNKFRKVVEEVKNKVKDSKIRIEYNVMEKKLEVYGDLVDIYYFGYYTKQFE